MEGNPESAEVNLLAAESMIGNAVGTDKDYMKTIRIILICDA